MYVVLKSWMLKTNWRIKSERSWRPKSWREGPHTLPIIDSWIDYYFINYFNVITTPSYLYACYSCDCYLWPWLMHSRFDKSNFQLWLFIKISKHLCWLYVDDICICDKNTSDTKNLPREVNRGHSELYFYIDFVNMLNVIAWFRHYQYPFNTYGDSVLLILEQLILIG